MLVDFTVENFRSIKGPVTLSAVAKPQAARQGSKRIKSDSDITPGFSLPGWNLELLPVLAIFGANASGKSNVIKALNYLLLMMFHGDQKIIEFFKVAFKYAKLIPFKLDNISAQEPTKFELRIALNEAIYTYTLVLKQNHIILESLDYTLVTTKRLRRLFNRRWDENAKRFIWKNGADFAGSHIQLQENIQEHELFISLIRKMKTDVIKDLFFWLHLCWIQVFMEEENFDHLIIFENINSKKPLEWFDSVIKVIKEFDTGISGIDKKKRSDESGYDLYALHNTNDGSKVSWLFEEESLGTQHLFNLAYRIVIAIENGGLVIVDELGNNIHPNITKSMIKMFQDPKINPKGAQLIMTSHDNTLQRNNLLRRDQIWFTQKRPDQSTELYPLTDFHIRNDLAIDKAYLDGRFGAVPFIPSDEEMTFKDEKLCQEN